MASVHCIHLLNDDEGGEEERKMGRCRIPCAVHVVSMCDDTEGLVHVVDIVSTWMEGWKEATSCQEKEKKKKIIKTGESETRPFLFLSLLQQK